MALYLSACNCTGVMIGCCFMEYLESLHEFRLEIDPAAD
jgi:hypothetical protein